MEKKPTVLSEKLQIKNSKILKFQNVQKFHISKCSRILCNKTITTLELDQ